MLQTVVKMQNDVEMTSQIVYFQFISLFRNKFTKRRYKFDEKTFFKENSLKRYKRTILVVSSFLFLLPWQQHTNSKFAISFEKSFVKQTQSVVCDINSYC